MRGELREEKQGEGVGSGRRPEGSTVQDGAGRQDDIAEEPEGGGSLRRAVTGNIA